MNSRLYLCKSAQILSDQIFTLEPITAFNDKREQICSLHVRVRSNNVKIIQNKTSRYIYKQIHDLAKD